MRLSAAVAIAGLVLGSAAPARADESSDRAMVVAVDVTSDVFMFGGIASSRTRGLFAAGAAGYFLGAPVVHLAHGKVSAAGTSLGLRVGAPLLFGLAGCVIGDDGKGTANDKSEIGLGCGIGAAAGMLVGFLGAQIVDWAWLSGGDDASTEARMFTIGATF